MKNKNNGITLIALIVTIVVLIVIAGVSLNIALGENGIFIKSKQAVDEYKKAAAAEKTELDSVFASLENASEGGMPVAQVLLNAKYSVAKTETGYIAADTENDMLYTMDENGGIVSREVLQYTDESAFTFNSSTGAITEITLTPEITATERIVVPKTIGGVKVTSVRFFYITFRSNPRNKDFYNTIWN